MSQEIPKYYVVAVFSYKTGGGMGEHDAITSALDAALENIAKGMSRTTKFLGTLSVDKVFLEEYLKEIME